MEVVMIAASSLSAASFSEAHRLLETGSRHFGGAIPIISLCNSPPHLKERFSGQQTSYGISDSGRKSRKQYSRCMRAEEERRRFVSGPPPKYPPSMMPDPLDVELDDEWEVPMVRRRSEARADLFIPEESEFDRRRGRGFTANYGDERPGPALFNGVNKFILGGIFVLGMGSGIVVDTTLNVEPNNVASREVIDRQTPNPDVCLANGMSAMVLDHRLFITFNPFNVYVSQAEVKPGCVLRQSNWSVIESRGLVSSDEVRDCKRNMNTFGFVGDLRQAPEISCVYHSESAENQFLKDPSKAALGDGFQPKDFDE